MKKLSPFELYFGDVVEFIDNDGNCTGEKLISRTNTSKEEALKIFYDFLDESGEYIEGEININIEDIKEGFVAYGFMEDWDRPCWTTCKPDRRGAKPVWILY